MEIKRQIKFFRRRKKLIFSGKGSYFEATFSQKPFGYIGGHAKCKVFEIHCNLAEKLPKMFQKLSLSSLCLIVFSEWFYLLFTVIFTMLETANIYDTTKVSRRAEIQHLKANFKHDNCNFFLFLTLRYMQNDVRSSKMWKSDFHWNDLYLQICLILKI